MKRGVKNTLRQISLKLPESREGIREMPALGCFRSLWQAPAWLRLTASRGTLGRLAPPATRARREREGEGGFARLHSSSIPYLVRHDAFFLGPQLGRYRK